MRLSSTLGPIAEAYALAWGLLLLVWLTLDWLSRFAPLDTLGMAVLGCVPAAVDFYTLQLRGEPFLPWDLAQVSEAAGVASAAGIHIQKSMAVSIALILAMVVGSFFLYRGRPKVKWTARLAGFGASAAAGCAASIWRVSAACGDTGTGHPARRLDAGPLLPLLTASSPAF